MKLNIFVLIGCLSTGFFLSFNSSFAEKQGKDFPQRDCSVQGTVFREIKMLDLNKDGQLETIRKYYCDVNRVPPYIDVEMKHKLALIPTGSFGEIDPSASRVNVNFDFHYQTTTPLGITEERDVYTFIDSLAGRCGIIYCSIAKDSAGNYMAFYEPTQVPNPNNNNWSFSDVHGVPFFDSVRGTMVNELYENVTNALVGIQYFPNGGDAITFFFYPKN